MTSSRDTDPSWSFRIRRPWLQPVKADADGNLGYEPCLDIPNCAFSLSHVPAMSVLGSLSGEIELLVTKRQAAGIRHWLKRGPLEIAEFLALKKAAQRVGRRSEFASSTLETKKSTVCGSFVIVRYLSSRESGERFLAELMEEGERIICSELQKLEPWRKIALIEGMLPPRTALAAHLTR